MLYSWQPIKSLSVLATETVSNRSVRKTSHRDGDFYSSCSRHPLTDNDSPYGTRSPYIYAVTYRSSSIPSAVFVFDKDLATELHSSTA